DFGMPYGGGQPENKPDFGMPYGGGQPESKPDFGMPYGGGQPESKPDFGMPYGGGQPENNPDFGAPYGGGQSESKPDFGAQYGGGQPESKPDFGMPYVGGQPESKPDFGTPYGGGQPDNKPDFGVPYPGAQAGRNQDDNSWQKPAFNDKAFGQSPMNGNQFDSSDAYPVPPQRESGQQDIARPMQGAGAGINSEELNAVKNQIMEQVHNETVNCFRNTESSIQNVVELINKQNTGSSAGTDNGLSGKLIVAALIVIVLDFIVSVTVLLKLFGII
ncbi:MAG: hypothetical protein J6P05_02470, partial [Lachnospiraceae bacterium]|nr:hypothetical protein [Lachnospiraceae bacterium]